VACVGGRLVGFVTVIHDGIEQLYVAEDARGGGVAAALLAPGERTIGGSNSRSRLGATRRHPPTSNPHKRWTYA
jgi:GNAT superfamily N-acetyltransferase